MAKVVIITGGIGSGKSTVCRMLEDCYGWPVYEADSQVKQLYVRHPRLLSDIEGALGERLRGDDGIFRPSALSARIFADASALAVVESLVFPVLTEDFEIWKSLHTEKDFVVLESATILEKPSLAELGDLIVVVDAPLQMRLERASLRDGISDVQVAQRAMNQKLMNSVSSGNIPPEVNFVIINDGSMSALERKVGDLVRKLTIT